MLWVRRYESVASKPWEAMGEPHLRDFLAILRRRFWIILSIVMAGTVISAIVGLLISPKYTAIAQLVVDLPNGYERAGPNALLEESIDTHLAVLGSRDFLLRVADQIAHKKSSAGSDPTTPTRSPENELQRASDELAPLLANDSQESLVAKLAHRLRIWTAALRRHSEGVTPTVDELQRGVHVNQERRSRVISIAFTSKTPGKAAHLANTIAQFYVASQSGQTYGLASSELKRLRQRIAEIKSELNKAGAAIQDAIIGRKVGGSGEGSNGDMQGPLSDLERDAANKTRLYTSLLRREKELREQQALMTPGIRVLAVAEPPDRPSSHNPLLFIVPAAVILLIGSVVIAIMLDRLDRGIRSERDIGEIDVPCAGLVPRLSGQLRDINGDTFQTSFAPFAESIRSVSATLQLLRSDASRRIVLITSSVPNEGKTTLAVSVATYLASAGRKVLLADLNLRHPNTFLETGSFVHSRASRECLGEDVIQHSAKLGVDCLTVRSASDPVSLFSGEQFAELLQRLRSSYDNILLDGPPVLGAGETRLLVGLADEALLAVKWGHTKRELVQNALGVLSCINHSNGNGDAQVAVVITQVDIRAHARYGYGDTIEAFVKYYSYYSRRRLINLNADSGAEKPAAQSISRKDARFRS